MALLALAYMRLNWETLDDYDNEAYVVLVRIGVVQRGRFLALHVALHFGADESASFPVEFV